MTVDQATTISKYTQEIKELLLRSGIELHNEAEVGLSDLLRGYRNTMELEISAELANEGFPTRIRCSSCGKSVSTGVPKHTIVRAWIQCPECIEKEDQNGKGN